MLEGILLYDHEDDSWLLRRDDGIEVAVDGLVYNLIALGYDLNEGERIEVFIKKKTD